MPDTPPIDPVELTAALVRCPSVTPVEGGALVLVENALTEAGFACTRVDRGDVANLFARWGPKGHPRTFGFNGHTDVVPPGEAALWSFDPFGGRVVDGTLQGRGATDMKSGVAAFVAAASAFAAEHAPDGAIVLAITGDEEGDATDGTRALLDWMDANGERMDVCLVGEPTSREVLGDTIKIGRRGSMSAWFTVSGLQGHTAYPSRARNAADAVARLISRLVVHEIDEGSEHFDPSTLSVTTIDVGNDTTNVIPARATATVNIRFSDRQTSGTITRWLEAEADAVRAETGCGIEMKTRVSGESFLTPPGPLSDLVSAAVAAETGRTPAISTSGGTSDARFVRAHCPVVEFGLTGKTMHQVDECVPADEIVRLTAVYRRILSDYFA